LDEWLHLALCVGFLFSPAQKKRAHGALLPDDSSARQAWGQPPIGLAEAGASVLLSAPATDPSPFFWLLSPVV
jgi:hypothetical protein